MSHFVDIEKGTGSSNNTSAEHVDICEEPRLQRVATSATSLTMSPELFEKLYLSPQNKVKGDLRKTFANPTPLGLAGLLLAATPLACQLLGWQGSAGNGASLNGVAVWLGGVVMLLAGVLEFVLGNTFSFTVFCVFGGFWVSFGTTLYPTSAAVSIFITEEYPNGLDNPQFYSTFAFVYLFLGLMCVIFFVCSLRLNICFAAVFLLLSILKPMLAGVYFFIGQGKNEYALSLERVAGVVLMVAILLVWYCFLAVMLEGVDFPIQLPVGDLSQRFKGRTDRLKLKAKDI